MRHSIYVHIPFCHHRCAYCDFNTFEGQELLIPAYVEALCREVEYVGARASRDTRVQTVFFGGGTPSLLSGHQIARVLGTLRAQFDVAAGAEITLEANPGTISPEGLDGLRAAGVNRLSLGVQSANGEELRLLERSHTYAEVLTAVSAARRAGFDNLNIDLIFGLPGQEMATWTETMRRALDLNPEHVSAYALTMEHGAPFGRWAQRGLMAAPDPDLAAEMYEWAADKLEMTGFVQYEISNWALPGHECQHNLQYWRSEPYLGIGAGAHGYASGCRYSNVLSIGDYIDRLIALDAADGPSDRRRPQFPCSPAALSVHRQTRRDEMAEFMMMGLRLTGEGIHRPTFERRFECNILDVFGEPIRRLVSLGLLVWTPPAKSRAASPPAGGIRDDDQSQLRLSRRGRLLGNRAFVEFLDPA